MRDEVEEDQILGGWMVVDGLGGLREKEYRLSVYDWQKWMEEKIMWEKGAEEEDGSV